jgi:hypothetical protein
MEKTDSKGLKEIFKANVNSPYRKCVLPEAVYEHAPLRANYRLCIVGDSGNGSKRQMMVGAQLRSKCDSVRHVGDIIYYTGIKSMEDPLFFSRFHKAYENLGIPMSLTIGNHDYYFPETWFEVSKRYPKKYILPNYFYLDNYKGHWKKGICFITLDTTPFNQSKNSCVPRMKTQLEWLNKNHPYLNKKCRIKILITHHPPVMPSKDRRISGPLKDLYRDFLYDNMDILITGHDHFLAYYPNVSPYEEKRIPLIISGSGGMLSTNEVSEKVGQIWFRENGFVQIIIKNPGYKGKFRALIHYFNHEGTPLYRTEYTQP